MSGRSPLRTCMGCGQRDLKSVLRRVAITEEGLQPEEHSGRGGYLHDSEDCRRAFLKRKSLYRAFRRDLPRKDREGLLAKLGAQRSGK